VALENNKLVLFIVAVKTRLLFVAPAFVALTSPYVAATLLRSITRKTKREKERKKRKD
jgi:hypothetical protein